MSCPDCGSDDLNWHEFDYGVCCETGYHDAGVYMVCGNCGARHDEHDME